MKKELGIFILLICLCVVVSILNPRFLAGANLQNMARLIGAYGIFSIGIGIVISGWAEHQLAQVGSGVESFAKLGDSILLPR